MYIHEIGRMDALPYGAAEMDPILGSRGAAADDISPRPLAGEGEGVRAAA
jgi:hypothetical protein